MKVAQYVLFVFALILLINSAFALGVAPSRKIIDFNSNIEQDIHFKVLNGENRDLDLYVYARGDLKNYVSIQNEFIHIFASQKEATIKYTVNVPYSARIPGTNAIEIVVEELATNHDKNTVVTGRLAVVHQLLLESTTYGKHLGVVFSGNNYDYGEKTELTFYLSNDGTEDIPNIEANVAIYDSRSKLISEDTTLIEELKLGNKIKQLIVVDGVLPPGEYDAYATISYDDKIINKETRFVVNGNPIEIEGVGSPDFKLGLINKLDIYIRNRMNENAESIFANIVITDENENVLTNFKTAPSDVAEFSRDILSGYWNTATIQPGVYYLSVEIDYEGKKSKTGFGIQITKDGLIMIGTGITGNVILEPVSNNRGIASILAGLFILLLIVNIVLILHFKRQRPPENI